MNPLKVAHVLQGLGRGGAEQLVIDLVRARPKGPVRYSVVSLYREASSARIKGLEDAGVPFFHTNKASHPDPAALFALIRVLHQVHPDIVHTHTFSGLVYGHAAAVACGIPKIVHTDHASGNLGAVYGKLQWLTEFLERHESAVITFSDSLKSRLVASRRLRPERVHVIPNGVPIRPLAGENERARIRKQFGINADEIFVLSVGGLRPEKNYQLLLRAIAKIQREAPELSLRTWIVGEGTEREGLMKSIGSLSLSATSLAGERDDISELMQACDVYVNTSAWEGMPIAVLEAMAAGRAVVAPRIGMMPELLSAAGVLVDADELSVASAIIRLGTDFSRRSQLGSLARALVVEKFSIDRAAELHEALYFGLLSRLRAGSTN